MNRLTVFIICIIISTAAFSQGLRLSVSDQPLDKVLLNLNVEISFDSKALAPYTVSANKNFKNPKEAIDYLLKGKPFACEQINGVYVILPHKQEAAIPPKTEYTLSGYITDRETEERLPYSYIQSANTTAATNEDGYFRLKQTDNKTFRIRVQYLGYIPLDTVLVTGQHTLSLSPKSITLAPITIQSSPATMMMQTGNISGEIRINHTIARYMPGSGDNSVFNLLRMMPGVRASGEPSDEFVVWGSSGGESRISYDGFSLYGMKSFNDNISSVNPYMVKDIRLMKGGYDASIGNQVGALARIIGIDGQKNKPAVKANLSNLTANLFASVPINKQTVLTTAYRQTFYNLYESELLNPFNGKRPMQSGGKGKGKQPSTAVTDTYVFPDYGFRDFNLKLSSTLSETDSYYISAYAASDKFDFTLKSEDESEIEATHNATQYAIAGNYDKVWANGSSTKLLISYSQLGSEEDHISIPKGQQQEISSIHVDNLMQEFSLDLSHRFQLGQIQKITIGTQWNSYSNKLNEEKNALSYPSLYAVDNLVLDPITLSGSLRADLTPQKLNIQPRISGAYSFSENMKATASWGLYKQYVARNPIMNDQNNMAFAWQITDKEALQSQHVLAGLAYSKNGFLASVEGYNKYIHNATRFYKDEIYNTDINIWGMDVFLKKELGKSSVFGSYSLADISEKNSETGHEIKLGGLLAVSPFYISSNFVYGTGFNVASIGQQGMGQGQNNKVPTTNGDYSRLDVAATYRLELKKCTLQTGLSLINIFNTQNAKYDYSLGGKQDVANVYTQAIPFTPMIFLEILF